MLDANKLPGWLIDDLIEGDRFDEPVNVAEIEQMTAEQAFKRWFDAITGLYGMHKEVYETLTTLLQAEK